MVPGYNLVDISILKAEYDLWEGDLKTQYQCV